MMVLPDGQKSFKIGLAT